MDIQSFRKAAVAGFFEGLKTGDLARASQLLHPSVTIREPDELPYGGVYHGLKGFYDIMSFFSGPLQLTIRSVEALDAAPYGIGYINFTYRSSLTDEEVTTTSLDLVEFAEDKRIIAITPHLFRPHAVMLLHERNKDSFEKMVLA